MIKRWIIFIVGINVLAIGIILNTKTLLGVGSINTLPYVLSDILSMSLGTVTTIIYIIYVVIQLIMLKKLDIQIIMQFPFSIIFGYLIDFYDMFLEFKMNIYTQMILLIIAILSTSLGAFLMIVGDIVLNPGDGIVHTIAKVTKKDFGIVKNIFDIIIIFTAIILSLITKGNIIGIGIGTILSAIFIGRVIVVYQKIYDKYLYNFSLNLIKLLLIN